MGFKRKNPGNQSIRRQLTFYMGFFVVLPLCLALMLLNFYLQKVTTENKINNETNLLSQIRDNADQMIEVTNYATSMLMTNKNTLKNLRTLEQDGDSYEIYQAKRELSNDISNVESSVLNAVNGKVAILTKTGYVIGSYALSRTETDYEKEQWYQEVLKNGRSTRHNSSWSMQRFVKSMMRLKNLRGGWPGLIMVLPNGGRWRRPVSLPLPAYP